LIFLVSIVNGGERLWQGEAFWATWHLVVVPVTVVIVF
jgi:hypothetical protein